MKLVSKLSSAFILATLIACGGKQEKPEIYGKEVIEGTEAEALNNPTENNNPAPKPSGKTGATLGKEIFEGKGTCMNCHKENEKTVGPSIKDISKNYKEKNGSIVNFLQEKSEAIVDPTQYAIMKANFAITKNLSEEELKGIEEYILSH